MIPGQGGPPVRDEKFFPQVSRNLTNVVELLTNSGTKADRCSANAAGGYTREGAAPPPPLVPRRPLVGVRRTFSGKRCTVLHVGCSGPRRIKSPVLIRIETLNRRK